MLNWSQESGYTEHMKHPVYNKTVINLYLELDSRLVVYFQKHFTFHTKCFYISVNMRKCVAFNIALPNH